jgi:hypothetical protein
LNFFYLKKIVKYPNDTLDYGLGSSRSGQLETRLFPGYASNQANIYVQIYDEDEAFAIYEIQSPIMIYADRTNFTNTMSKLISNEPRFETNQILKEGSYLSSLQEIQTISSLLNEQSLTNKFDLIKSERNSSLFPQTFGPLFKYSQNRAVRKPKKNYSSLVKTFL